MVLTGDIFAYDCTEVQSLRRNLGEPVLTQRFFNMTHAPPATFERMAQEYNSKKLTLILP